MVISKWSSLVSCLYPNPNPNPKPNPNPNQTKPNPITCYFRQSSSLILRYPPSTFHFRLSLCQLRALAHNPRIQCILTSYMTYNLHKLHVLQWTQSFNTFKTCIMHREKTATTVPSTSID